MLDENCLFCKIISGDIPAIKEYDDDNVCVFRDINPQAPTHLLAIPKRHYANVHDMPSNEVYAMAQLFDAINKVIFQEELLQQGGYRLVINSGKLAGQEVPHVHVHILSGRPFTWPPG